MTVSTWCDSYEKHKANLKANHGKPCEKHGGKQETPIEKVHHRNAKGWTIKWNVSRKTNNNPESITISKCAYAHFSGSIKNLQRSQQKILQRIRKQVHHHWKDSEDSSSSCCEQPNTLQECSCKSKRACRHLISPDISSL